MATTDHTLVSDLLTALKVPFTKDYTKQRFETMPFKTLFGVTQLLKEYGVESKGYSFSDKETLPSLPVPFLAQTRGGLVIVTKINPQTGTVNYLTQGVPETMPENEFCKVWTGTVLLVTSNKGAKEPDLAAHRSKVFLNQAKKVALVALAVALVVYLYFTNRLWQYPSIWALTAVDIFGLWITYLLVQKSLSIKNPVADKVCGVLQAGGCDSILKTDASSFFGIFNWSEVGFSYFGISLLAMLIAPSTMHWLGVINLCCLPYTIWSISYQKFVAKHWCTLCVSVQLSLWLQFFCYLFGHWTFPIFPLNIGFFALCATYLVVVLLLNRVLPHFTNQKQ